MIPDSIDVMPGNKPIDMRHTFLLHTDRRSESTEPICSSPKTWQEDEGSCALVLHQVALKTLIQQLPQGNHTIYSQNCTGSVKGNESGKRVTIPSEQRIAQTARKPTLHRDRRHPPRHRLHVTQRQRQPRC
jgi:hypothetical protein